MWREGVKSKFFILFITVALLAFAAAPAAAQSVQFACADGTTFGNAVEVLLNVRPGTYTVTALGIDGFDPRLAVVLDADESEIGCADDSDGAGEYSVTLPTTGTVEASSFNAQITFTDDNADLTAITRYRAIVGGFGDTTGAFVLLFEGGQYTSDEANDLGDMYNAHITNNMRVSGVPISFYAIGTDEAFDPYFTLVNLANAPYVDMQGVAWECDDAGSARCWGENTDLSGSSIGSGKSTVQADGFDAMMTTPDDLLGLSPGEEAYLNWRVSSFGGASTGAYIVAFHLGIGDSGIIPPSEVQAFPIGWTDNAQSIAGEAGTEALVECPPRGSAGALWGTDIYTDDSSICTAAAHAGIITLEAGGLVMVTILPGQDSYDSTERNGIASGSWGSWRRSFSVVGIEAQEATATPEAETIFIGRVNGVVIELDQSLTGNWNGIDAVELVGVDGDKIVRQWAFSATASSEFSEASAAAQAVGAPNAPDCSNSSAVWYSLTSGEQATLTLTFAQAVDPREVNIYQNWAPGAITAVYLIDAETGEQVRIPDSADPNPDGECPRVYNIALELVE
jgi:hypothetical protein